MSSTVAQQGVSPIKEQPASAILWQYHVRKDATQIGCGFWTSASAGNFNIAIEDDDSPQAFRLVMNKAKAEELRKHIDTFLADPDLHQSRFGMES